MLPAILLIIAVVANYAPEILVALGLGSLGAWFVIAKGAQLTALWWIVGKLAEAVVQHRPDHRPYLMPTQAVCTYGIFEAAQVPICRLVFPMDQPPPPHPEGVCGAAGLPTYHVAPLLISLCAVAVARLALIRNTS